MLYVYLILLYILSYGMSLEDRQGGCEEVEIVSRKEWRARDNIRRWPMATPVNQVIIQHTVTVPCKSKHQCMRLIQTIQDDHMDYQGYGDIAYNFLIGSDGRAYEGRGWMLRGSHTINFNTNSVGIAFIGNFNQIHPNKKMINAALNLIKCGVRKGYLTPVREIYGHRDVGCTESPGKNLYQEIRKWPNYKGGRMPLYTC